ncbi:helix-turn-helix domain-containing protein [Pseudooceanicola antarcticus]|uniref:XRE family transcriptional regulator n=3 Tax=Pseudooceanicola antarcticus TaxID=1247613 RepID=A0ABX4MQM8_9RHOB|nr:helix-turn-helix transcriptional regulator [Pseudooceanicola antarcticus]PJE30342.1 XRE family transcriptional regulator [Pseudooceanicola antarcticus]
MKSLCFLRRPKSGKIWQVFDLMKERSMPFQFKPDPDQDNLVIRPGMSAQQKGWIRRKQIERSQSARAQEAEEARTFERIRRRSEMSLSQGLRKYRGRRELTQDQLAEELGCSVRAYRGYESGERDMPSSLLLQILAREDVDMHDLLNVRRDPVWAETRDMVIDRYNEAMALLSQHDLYLAVDAEAPARRIAGEINELGAEQTTSIAMRVEEEWLHLDRWYQAGGWGWDGVEDLWKEQQEEERRAERRARDAKRRDHG